MAIFTSSTSTNPVRPEDGFTPTPIEDQASLRGLTLFNKIHLLGKFTWKEKKVGVFNPRLVSGFTLLETLVVVGITVILTSMVAGYSREGGRQLALVATETKMLNMLSRAKFLSIETFFGGGRSGDQRICAYGVRIEGDQMFIFQDVSTNKTCQEGQGDNDKQYTPTPGLNERLTGELNEIKLQDTPVGFTGETDLREVIFIPPDPQTKIKRTDNSEVEEAKLSVKIKEGSGSFVITVNKYGQIKAK